MVAQTGWIRYRIAGRGGGGWDVDRWYFSQGIEELSADERRESIVTECHSWALYAEHYTFREWIGEMPPADVLQGKLEALDREKSYIDEERKTISRQLELKTELTTI
jgi:hypothetical protein